MSDEERIEQLELEVKVLRDNNKGLKDKIDEQSKEIEELEKNRKVSQNFAKIVATDYISKDKIKAKIEEYKKQQKEEPDVYLCIKALSSLLEKE